MPRSWLISKGAVWVSGWLDRPAEVAVGGTLADVEDDQYGGISTFATYLELEPGEHAIPITATDRFGLENVVTLHHFENMAKIMMVTGWIVGYAYIMEFFIAWYSGNPVEGFAFLNRAFGPYAWAYWIMVSCNVISPQLFWFKKILTSVVEVFILLDDSEAVSRFTNMQVKVEIQP